MISQAELKRLRKGADIHDKFNSDENTFRLQLSSNGNVMGVRYSEGDLLRMGYVIIPSKVSNWRSEINSGFKPKAL